MDATTLSTDAIAVTHYKISFAVKVQSLMTHSVVVHETVLIFLKAQIMIFIRFKNKSEKSIILYAAHSRQIA